MYNIFLTIVVTWGAFMIGFSIIGVEDSVHRMMLSHDMLAYKNGTDVMMPNWMHPHTASGGPLPNKDLMLGEKAAVSSS